MNRIARIVLAALIGVGILAVPAHADGTRQEVCVEGPTGWYAFAIETDEDRAAVAGLRVEPFPNSIAGCAAYGPLAPAPQLPPAPEPCTPVEVVKVVKVPVEVIRYVDRVIETSSVQTVEDTHRVTQLQEQVTRQQALIQKLRAKLARR